MRGGKVGNVRLRSESLENSQKTKIRVCSSTPPLHEKKYIFCGRGGVSACSIGW